MSASPDKIDFTQPQPFLHPFPDPADVFASDPAQAAKLLHPLVSIDLSAVDPAWSGRIHLLSPVEPYDDYFADGAEAYHSYYTRRNWIGFRLGEDSRYELLGDWRCFQAMSEDKTRSQDPELLEHYGKQQQSFDEVKAAYAERGLLMNVDLGKREGEAQMLKYRLAFLEDWKESQGAGNWADPDLFPLEFVDNPEMDWEDAFPLTEDGRPFRFVAAVPGWNYRDGGADQILLFYDPQTRVALLTFEWS